MFTFLKVKRSLKRKKENHSFYHHAQQPLLVCYHFWLSSQQIWKNLFPPCRRAKARKRPEFCPSLGSQITDKLVFTDTTKLSLALFLLITLPVKRFLSQFFFLSSISNRINVHIHQQYTETWERPQGKTGRCNQTSQQTDLAKQSTEMMIQE